eukprot:COSAG03_NODE_50_length_16299_cov_20.189877_9_plen_565_part_00
MNGAARYTTSERNGHAAVCCFMSRKISPSPRYRAAAQQCSRPCETEHDTAEAAVQLLMVMLYSCCFYALTSSALIPSSTAVVLCEGNTDWKGKLKTDDFDGGVAYHNGGTGGLHTVHNASVFQPWPGADDHLHVTQSRSGVALRLTVPCARLMGLALMIDGRVVHVNRVARCQTDESEERYAMEPRMLSALRLSIAVSPAGPSTDITADFEILDLTRGAHCVAAYAQLSTEVAAHFETSRVGLLNLWVQSEEALERARVYPPARPAFAVYYTPYTTVTALVMQEVAAKAQSPTGVTVESLLRNQSLRFADVFSRHGAIVAPFLSALNKSMHGQLPEMGIAGRSDFFQHEPALGFYCFYRRKPGEPFILPDCPNITATATAHASMFSSAGIDFLVFDATNDGTSNGNANALATNKRPIETVFEEFHSLRGAGHHTPQLSIWNRMNGKDDAWPFYLALYRNVSYQDLLVRQGVTGAAVFFVVAGNQHAGINGKTRVPWLCETQLNRTSLQRLQSAEGKYDIRLTTQEIWETNFNPGRDTGCLLRIICVSHIHRHYIQILHANFTYI